MNEYILDNILKISLTEFNESQSDPIKILDTPNGIFDIFFKKCQNGIPIQKEVGFHTLQEMKEIGSTKNKGDLFELFCQRYLINIKQYDEVWLLKELSNELKKQLKLPLGNKDYGIDLFCLKKDQYSAVQCKFKTPRPPIKVKNSQNEMKTIYPSVNWKELTTFNELCNASGPWKERITMTTAPSVRRFGGIKDPRDRSICLQTFKSLTPDQWSKLMQLPNPKFNAQAISIAKMESNQTLSNTGKIIIKLKQCPLSK